MRTLRTQVKWIMISVVVVFVLSILFMYGGGNRGRQQTGEKDYPVAEINGMTLMRSQLYRSMVNIAEQSGKRNVTPQDIVLYRKQVINDIAVGDELKKEVKSRKIKISDADVTAAYKEIENQFPTKEAFMEYMEGVGITEKKLKEQIKDDLARKALIAQAEAGVVATDEELQETYDSLKGLVFTQPRVVEVRVADFGEKKDAAEKALEQLESGVIWDAMVLSYLEELKEMTSGDQTIPFVENQVPPMLWDAVSAVEDGGFVGPLEVASQDFFLMEKVSDKASSTLSFDEVSADLREMVVAQKKQNARNQFFDTLLKRAKIEILDASLFETPSAETSQDVAENEKSAKKVSEDLAQSPAPSE